MYELYSLSFKRKNMTVKEYIKAFLRTSSEFQGEGEIVKAGEGSMDAEQIVESVISDVRETMKKHRGLLNLQENERSQEEVTNTEIPARILRRHSLMVRHEVKQCLAGKKQLSGRQGQVARRLLNDLTRQLKINDLGETFGKIEERAYQIEFPPKIQPSGNDDPIMKRIEKRMEDPEYRELMERLRREGKIC